MAHHPAQTNLQLYNQLVASSWPADDLRRVRAAYEFADAMFVGARRGSGKPFIAHLVGTASVAADVDGRTDVVLAALLHAVYTRGGSTMSSRAPSREPIRSLVGTVAEALIHAYASCAWGPEAFADAVANGADFDRTRRDVLLLRLVNEVDEHADLGTRYGDKGAFLRDSAEPLLPMAELADRLGCPKLAAAFRGILDRERDVDVPSVLRSSTCPSAARVSSSTLSRVTDSARTVTVRGRRLLMSVPGARATVHAVRKLNPGAHSPARDL